MPVSTRSASARSTAVSLSNNDAVRGATSVNRSNRDRNRDGHVDHQLTPTRSSEKSQNPSSAPSFVPSVMVDIPPSYDIDLSLPPEERYVALASDFAWNIQELIGIFDEVLTLVRLPISSEHLKRLAKLILRRVHDSEQQAELRGISKATGVEMYLLVAFNILLDLFMGCTSGGVRVTDGPGEPTKMIHFRMLDWGMDALRKVVVQLNFVCDGKVVARSVTYAGFVGIITGVRYVLPLSCCEEMERQFDRQALPPGAQLNASITRAGKGNADDANRKDLSVSLNFRAVHNNSTSIWSNILYYGNHLGILLGLRPSIASTVRHLLIPRSEPSKTVSPSEKGRSRKIWRPSSSSKKILSLPFSSLLSRLASTKTTSCYLILCTGDQTASMEKDRITAAMRVSTEFVVTTNHDLAHEEYCTASEVDIPVATATGNHTSKPPSGPETKPRGGQPAAAVSEAQATKPPSAEHIASTDFARGSTAMQFKQKTAGPGATEERNDSANDFKDAGDDSSPSRPGREHLRLSIDRPAMFSWDGHGVLPNPLATGHQHPPHAAGSIEVADSIRRASMASTTERDNESLACFSDATTSSGLRFLGMEELLQDSMERKQCVAGKYSNLAEAYRHAHASSSSRSVEDSNKELEVAIEPNEVEKWVTSYPTLNECTHYAVIMDPKEGEIRWLRRWLEPYEDVEEQTEYVREQIIGAAGHDGVSRL
jgi:hypothetical protein